MQGLCEWRKVYTELSPCYFIGNFKAKQSMSFIHDSSSGNSCFHSTFSKTGNKYVLLSYFHALKNPTLVFIVQFVFWGLCSIIQPALFQPIMDFCSLNVKVKKSQWFPQQVFFSYTCAKCVPASHWASCLGRCRQNFPRHRGKSCRQWGTKPAMVTSGSSLEHSRTSWCLPWDTQCSSQHQYQHFSPAAAVTCISRIQSTILPSLTWCT